MPVQQGQIVAKLIPTEPVLINEALPVAGMVSLSYTDVNTQLANTRIITKAQFESLEVLADEGGFDFQGKFTFFALIADPYLP